MCGLGVFDQGPGDPEDHGEYPIIGESRFRAHA